MNDHSIPPEMNEIELDGDDAADPRDVDGPADEHPLRAAHLDEKREAMKHFQPGPETVAPPVPDPATLQHHD